MANVKIFRLSTGEDIIGEKLAVSKETTLIKHPFTIVPMQEGPGKPVKLALSPYIPYSDGDEVDIKTANIIAEVKPQLNIINSYNQNVGTGIVQVSKPQLIT